MEAVAAVAVVAVAVVAVVVVAAVAAAVVAVEAAVVVAAGVEPVPMPMRPHGGPGAGRCRCWDVPTWWHSCLR